MATYPIKVLLDRNRQPFIPFATTSSIVENGTNRRLDKILGNLDDLQTNNKNSLVSAINEILTQHGSGGSSTGWQVVDKLPTENISATTIYLLPKEGSTKPNIYEEWIWVNEDWESIGTTEIDLSGYATTTMVGDLNTLQTTDKDCVVDAINELVNKQLVAGDGIAIDGNVISISVGNRSNTVFFHNSSITKSTMQEVYNTMKTGKNCIISVGFRNRIDAGDTTMLFFSPDVSDLDLETYTGSLFFFTPIVYRVGSDFNQQSIQNQVTRYYIKLTVENGNVTVVGNVTVFQSNNNSNNTSIPVLGTNNLASYTPTADYHPATKKYVDDAIAAAGTGSGSAFDPAKYLAIDNTTEYTPTDLYHPATKAYVDSQIASVPEPVDAYSKTEIDGKLSNYLSKTNTESYTPTSDYHPATKKFVESVVASIDTSGFITDSNISEHLANYITETTLNERLMKVPYIMTPSVTITSDHASSDYWGDNTLTCNINNTDWLGAIQKIAQAILSKNWPKVYLPVSVFPNVDDFNRTQTNKMFRRHFLMELKPSNFGYFANEISHTYTAGDEISTYFDGIIDLGIYGTLNVSFSITYQYDGTSWTYSSYSNPYAHLYIGRVTPVSSLNLTFDNKQIVHSYTEGYKHSRVFSSQVTGCKNLPVNATTKIANLAGTSTLPDGLSIKCELLGTTVSNGVTTYTPLGEATVFVYNKEMYMKVPDITTTDYTDVVCTISMIYED